MDFQSKLQAFLVFFVLTTACQTWLANADSALEEDRDALVQFNDVLSGFYFIYFINFAAIHITNINTDIGKVGLVTVTASANYCVPNSSTITNKKNTTNYNTR